ncbi:MAG: entericidin A/B family lipoprotein [Rhodospirillales bacterium]|nr:entericidin A/B family lipoprotein [Rhodospirillales bacterium]MCB9964624.1 entericidin A/B family lipoprotein [Rhodospirillales bacterium]MCB9979914.1 entericidin A/B family lipoprotein [Rhodospirillales bacterium]
MNILKFGILAVCFLGVVSLTGCGTMKGVGQDLEAAGRTIRNVAD